MLKVVYCIFVGKVSPKDKVTYLFVKLLSGIYKMIQKTLFKYIIGSVPLVGHSLVWFGIHIIKIDKVRTNESKYIIFYI